MGSMICGLSLGCSMLRYVSMMDSTLFTVGAVVGKSRWVVKKNMEL